MSKRHTSKVGKFISMACLLFVCATVQSCRDEYYYDDREPDFLGASIYEYLEEKGNFTLFLKVIEDLNYKDVLSKTGSKTLFVANDDAFLKGIKEEWGYDSYEQLTPAHKRIILNNAMLDNAYLLELMSNTPASDEKSEPNIGRCLRQVTSATTTDSIGLFFDADLPQNNPDWDKFRTNGIRLALDGTQTMMVHFLEEQLYQNSISDEDLNIILNHRYGATTKDAFIFDKKVINQNATCKNGYVHELDGLLIAPSNMAEEIRTSGKTDIFSRMLDRFAVPVPNTTLTADFNRIYHYGDDANAEYVYEKRYYTSGSNRGVATTGNGTGYLSYRDIDDLEHNAKASLLFDPGWNEYKAGTSGATTKENDMAVIFAPSDDALKTYFTVGEGQALIERYGRNVTDPFGAGLEEAIDSIPLEDIQYLMRNMMKNSFNNAVPSKFSSIMDDARDPMGIQKDHIDECIIANNGLVYVTNAVYSPARYVAVTAPVMLSDSLNIANWAINQYEYDKYLLAMGSHFSLVVPSDSCFKYLDPKTINDPTPIMYIFKYNKDAKSEAGKVFAEQWECDPATLEPVKFVKNETGSTRLKNLLTNMYEYYIVVGDFTNGNKYHMTKGYGTIKVEYDATEDEVTKIFGGAEVEDNTYRAIGHTYNQKNGKTYRLDAGMIQPPTKSVNKVMETTPEFAKFYELCVGNDDVLTAIAPVDKKGVVIDDSIARYRIFENLGGLDLNVRTFNTYHYTVYVPTNEQIDIAYTLGLPNWDDCEAAALELQAIDAKRADMELEYGDLVSNPDATQEQIDAILAQIDAYTVEIATKKAALKADVELIVNFVKYHFQDNSVYVDNLPHSIIEGEETKYVINYETAALDEVTKRFSAVTVQTQNGTISVKGDIEDFDNTCYVNNAEGTEGILHNIMTRDIEFSGQNIETSSYAVVHQIHATNGGLGFLVNDRIFDAETGKFKK